MTIKRTVHVVARSASGALMDVRHARWDGLRVVWEGNVRQYEDGTVLGLPLRAHLYSVDVTLADDTKPKR